MGSFFVFLVESSAEDLSVKDENKEASNARREYTILNTVLSLKKHAIILHFFCKIAAWKRNLEKAFDAVDVVEQNIVQTTTLGKFLYIFEFLSFGFFTKNLKNVHCLFIDENVGSHDTPKRPRQDMTEAERLADEELKRLVTYYRRVPYEGVDRVWVYVKRLGRVVNFQITNVPFLIERFVRFYLSGNSLGDLSKIETALDSCLALVRQAKQDMEISI